jgi:hypothetical protein
MNKKYIIDREHLIVEFESEFNIFEEIHDKKYCVTLKDDFASNTEKYTARIWFTINPVKIDGKEVKRIIKEFETNFTKREELDADKIIKYKETLENNIEWVLKNKIVGTRKKLEILF